ncbi:MAG TPA: DinB family protein [Gemmatimonadales bacterium]|nr:DinB family protein [Gemmatimonadales bacterium]
MSLAQSLLAELDHEMAGTRRELERVPEDRLAWKPHAKSMTLGRLASHLAELPSWGAMTVRTTELDISPPGSTATRATFSSRAEILAHFDKCLADARAAIGATPDAEFMVPWTMLKAGQTVFSLPRIAVLRSMVLNHNVHHRAQLGVYLRLLDIPLPSLYGPSADER